MEGEYQIYFETEDRSIRFTIGNSIFNIFKGTILDNLIIFITKYKPTKVGMLKLDKRTDVWKTIWEYDLK